MPGVKPRIGRLFTTEDDKKDADRTVLLSYELWQQDFGGDRRSLEIAAPRGSHRSDSVHHHWVVLPRDFHFTVTGFAFAGSYVETELQRPVSPDSPWSQNTIFASIFGPTSSVSWNANT